MRLSEALKDMHPAIASKIEELRRHDDPVQMNTAADFLNISPRQVRNLCQGCLLEFIADPYRKIFQDSLIKYFLARHEMDYIDVD